MSSSVAGYKGYSDLVDQQAEGSDYKVHICAHSPVFADSGAQGLRDDAQDKSHWGFLQPFLRRADIVFLLPRPLRFVPVFCHRTPKVAVPLPFRVGCELAERVGFEPTWGVSPQQISSLRRYDRFGTSPEEVKLYLESPRKDRGGMIGVNHMLGAMVMGMRP